MRIYRIILVGVLLFLSGSMAAQSYWIEGRVKDAETNEPLVRASIILKDTNIGTVAWLEGGVYSLTIPEKDSAGMLVFSYVGYERQEVPIAGRHVVDVLLRRVSDTVKVEFLYMPIVKRVTRTAQATK